MKTVHVPRSILLTICLSTLLLAGSALARSPLDGQLIVSNDRLSAVSVTVDDRYLGRVSPGQNNRFNHIPNGVRLVKISSRIGPGLTQRIAIPVSGTARLKVRPLRGDARIKNTSKIRLKVVINNRYAGTLAPGASMVSSRLSPGTHKLRAYPARDYIARGATVEKRFAVRAGDRVQVNLGPFMAKLKITNPYRRGVKIFVDGKRVARIPGYGSTILRDLIPGAHRITMRRRGRTVSHIEMRLNVGQVASWIPQALRKGRMRIANRTHRHISVTVDGRSREWLAPGVSTTISRLKPGVHQVLIGYGRGRVEERMVRVPRHETARLNIDRPERGRVSYRHRRIGPVAQR
jgi:hypothetical protein